MNADQSGSSRSHGTVGGPSKDDSLDVQNTLPVSARRALWECLASANQSGNSSSHGVNGASSKSSSSSVQPLGVSKIENTRERIQPTSVSRIKADIPRSSVSQAEREKRERMRELAELRRSRRPPLPFPQTNTPSSNATENISSSSLESQCNEEYNTKQEEDFMLPSPPSPSEKIPTAENTLVDSSPCTPLSNIDLPPPEEIHGLCHTKEDEHDDKGKEEEEEDCAKNHDTHKMDICHVSW
ncbi:unnamed protein product [Trichobilharzia regenti]|nr:unnamed protein product [Trichobilharzia regenti]